VKYLPILILAAAIQMPAQAFAQALGYADADNPSEAVGMMKVQEYTAEVMKRECSARLPGQATQMQVNLDKWKTAEAHDLERANYHWERMAAKNPKMQETLVRAESSIKGHINLLEQSDPDHRTKAVSVFCLQHFSDLASGVWRKRTPRLFEFLDRAP
jgi:hypothetical protein